MRSLPLPQMGASTEVGVSRRVESSLSLNAGVVFFLAFSVAKYGLVVAGAGVRIAGIMIGIMGSKERIPSAQVQDGDEIH